MFSGFLLHMLNFQGYGEADLGGVSSGIRINTSGCPAAYLLVFKIDFSSEEKIGSCGKGVEKLKISQ